MAPRAPEEPPRRRDAAALLRVWTLAPTDLHVGRPLGGGSQSDVLAGTWHGLRVAIKQPRVAALASPAGSDSVRREGRALSRVQHPNVVRLYGFCNVPQPSVVMAFAPGGSLADQLLTRQSSLLDDSRLLRGIASGMASVHAHKVCTPKHTYVAHAAQNICCSRMLCLLADPPPRPQAAERAPRR